MTFLWNAVLGAESYAVDVYPDGNPSSLDFEITSVEDIYAATTTGYNMTLPDQNYSYFFHSLIECHYRKNS